MIITALDSRNQFALRWRDEDGKRIEKLVDYKDFQPYFYILSDSQKYPTAEIKERGAKFKLTLSYDEDGSVDLQNRAICKVTWLPAKPGYTRTLRELWDETFEADVPFHYRYSVDELTEIPEYNLVKWYWDLEWQQGGEHDGAITCISCYNDKEHGVLYWLPELDHEDWTKGHQVGFTTERDMLRHIIQLIDEEDTYMLI